MLESYADRSRILTYQSCPRRRYFEYEIPTDGVVNGVRPTKLDMNLLLGSGFHAGIEHILTGAMNGFGDDLGLWIEDAVDCALNGDGNFKGFWPQVKSYGLILEAEEDASYVAYEQAALLEALIRAYAIFVLPQVLERYTVVEVECEELATFEIPGFRLNFGARLDALLLDKSNLGLYVLSLKTAKEWGKRDDSSARHDMQGLSETRVVEQNLGRWQAILDALVSADPAVITAKARQCGFTDAHSQALQIPAWFIERYAQGAPPTVSGVVMQHAIKGRRENSPKGSGKYCFNNPLIRPWKKADDLGGDSYAFKYEFKDEMGGNHRLGKGWNRVNIWEDMGVKAWIDYLASRSLQGFPPGAALNGQFILPIEYFRNEEDMARWERQVVHQEARISEGRARVFMPQQVDGGTDPAYVSALLDEWFPMHTKSCDWPTKCSFQEVCFGPSAYLHDPISSGLYQIRVANHPTEVKCLTK